jgi:hypothetical protein
VAFYQFKRFRGGHEDLERWCQDWTHSICLKFGNNHKGMWSGYHRSLYVPKIGGEWNWSGFWKWCPELQCRTNNLELWRYLRNMYSVGYISACTIRLIRYRLILQISADLLFDLFSHHASSSYQSLDALMASFFRNLLLRQHVSNFRTKISFLLHYIIYLSDLTN